MRRMKFILAIDSYLARKGMVTVMNNIPGAFIVKEAENIQQLEQYLKIDAPDYLIICESLFSKATSIYIENPSLIEKTIVLYEGKSADPSREVKESIFFHDSRELIHTKIERLLTPDYNRQNEPLLPELSDREKTIVQYAATGHTNKEIAEKLFLSAHTVITHRKNISRKLGIKSVSGLTVYAIVNNIINIDEITGTNLSGK